VVRHARENLRRDLTPPYVPAVTVVAATATARTTATVAVFATTTAGASNISAAVRTIAHGRRRRRVYCRNSQ
jgi:hypothetical protein